MFDEYVRFHARSSPAKAAVITPERQVDFARLDADIDRAAVELQRFDLIPNEVVSLTVADEYLHWVIVLGLARLGIGASHAMDSCRVKITDRDPGDRHDHRLLDAGTMQIILDGPVQRPVRSLVDLAAPGRILKSSGTTGEIKRIEMSWRVIDAGIRNALIAYGAPDGPWMPATGIGTILGFIVALTCWASGNAVLLGGGLLLAEALSRFRPRLIAMVPNQLELLLRSLPPNHAPSELRVVTGGGSVPAELARLTRRRLTSDLRSVYGAAETGAVAIAALDVLEKYPSSAGFILPTVRVEVLDEQGIELPAGELGRLRIRSDRVADHYLDDPERSAEAFRDGWFYSNDLGRIGVDGLLTVEGRTDDLMNLAGHKVLPGWIEQIALAAPGIMEVCAFSLDDEMGLERLWLALVCTGEFSKAGLAHAMQRQLSWLTRVELFEFSKLPRNVMGKVERHRIREIVSTRLAQTNDLLPLQPQPDP